jgi:3-methyladenine DNA glycosylase AlkD
MTAHQALIDALRHTLAAHANPAQALPMQAYMKSALPFYGVAAPLRRQLVAAAVAAAAAPAVPAAVAHPAAQAATPPPLPDTTTLAATVLALWRGATHREERYAALDLLRLPRHGKLLTTALLPALQEMLVSGAWWDHCDEISGVALGRLLQAEPAPMKPVLRQWARGGNLWLRRAAMLSQRSLKTGFDAVLFYETLLPSLGDNTFAKEFFIRKGMGWALRERAYRAPEEVQAFCDEYANQMSPLTRREALKAISRRSN